MLFNKVFGLILKALTYNMYSTIPDTGAFFPPVGYVFIIDDDGFYLIDDDGYYLIATL